MTGHLRIIRNFLLIACSLLSLQAQAQIDFWQPASGPMLGASRVFASDSKGNLFTVTSFGQVLKLAFYRSSDGGDTWSEVNTDLPKICCLNVLRIDSNNDFWIVTEKGIYRSSNDGKNWLEVGNGSLPQTEIDQLIFDRAGNIFVGTEFGVYRSTDNGETWVRKGLTFVSALAAHSNGTLFAGSDFGTQGQMHRSSNMADSWQSVNTGLPEEFLRIEAIAIHTNGEVFVGTGSQGVFRLTDNGDSWQAFNVGLPDPTRVGDLVVNQNGDLLLGDDSGGGMYRYAYPDDSWASISAGLGYRPRVWFIRTGGSGDIFVGLRGTGLFRSVDDGDTWVSSSPGLTDTRVRKLAVQDDGDVFVGTDRAGVFRSSDQGSSWRQVNNGLDGLIINGLAVHNDGDLFAGTNGLFRSSDDGATWRKLDGGLPNQAISAVGIGDEGTLFASTGFQAFRSFDKGDTWQEIGGLGRAATTSFGFHCNGDVFASTREETSLGVFKRRLLLLIKHTSTWRKVNSIPRGDFFSMPFAFLDDGKILAGTNEGIYISSDHGSSWGEIDTAFPLESNPAAVAIVVNGNGDIYAATRLSVYRSSDNGENWTNLDGGLPNTNMRTLSISNNGIVYVGTFDGVYRSIEPMEVAEKTAVCTALTFRLEQNYPNPFNPKTSFQFHLAERSKVKLTVFDLKGRTLVTLAEGEFPGGDHEISYEPKNLASGVYFYQLQVEASSEISQRSFVETKRFTLVK